MKTKVTCMLLGFVATLLVSSTAFAQGKGNDQETGFFGDHFSLEGALELFRQAASPEAFEQALNSEASNVNNLDLNEDGEIDYIRVIDNMDGDVHAIVLQAVVSEDESQDVAVIEIEKQGPEEAILQIIGDEDIYGEQVIVEPFQEEVNDRGKKGGPSADIEVMRVVVNVWAWPSVRFIYAPGYVAWTSPWRWRYYPTWWRPWRPLAWSTFHARTRPFGTRYHVVTTHRVVRAHKVYTPRRTHSKVVRTRTTVVRKGPRGTTVGTRKTTTVKGRNGNVKARKSTTKVRRKKGGN